MIQNCQSKNKKNDNRWHPQITNGFWIDNKMFFSAANYNGLFSIDIRTGNVYLVGKLEEEAIDSVNLTSNIDESNNKIIISPCTAKNTYIFDREEGNITVWNTKKLKNQSFSTYKIEDKVAEEKIFFIIPTYGTIFGKIRNDFLGLENVIDFMKEYQKWTGERYIICSDSGVYIYNGYLYFAALECNLLVKINIVNHKIRFININNKEKINVSFFTFPSHCTLISFYTYRHIFYYSYHFFFLFLCYLLFLFSFLALEQIIIY